MKSLSKILVIFLIIAGIITGYFFARGSIEKAILKKIIARLEADSRIAEVVVTDSNFDPKINKTKTTVKFIEYDSKGKLLPPKYFTFPDNLIQFMSLVIRFDNAYVKNGDFLKGKSIYLFMKAFCLDGNKVESYTITPINEVPGGYKTGFGFGLFEKRIWRQFWKYALSPEEAKKEGIKVAQIEAPGTRFIPGLIYTLKIEHAGGIKIEAKRIPEILKR